MCFRVLFHHEDEGNYSLLSYEARIYHFDITGAKDGSAKECVRCPAGEYLTHTGAFCMKCPNGTFSLEGSTKCTHCPEGSFADKEGSGECTKCGEGTTSNNARDGCNYNNCRYQYNKDVVYDLSPLKSDGGPMYMVNVHKPKTKYFFPLHYYVNICSLKHDNTSCTTIKRIEDPVKSGVTIRKKVRNVNFVKPYCV